MPFQEIIKLCSRRYGTNLMKKYLKVRNLIHLWNIHHQLSQDVINVSSFQFHVLHEHIDNDI